MWLKAELFQRTGAFKVRGAFSRIAELTPDERACGIVTCSAGNHAADGGARGSRARHGRARDDAELGEPGEGGRDPRLRRDEVDLEAVDATEAFARMHAEADGRAV